MIMCNFCGADNDDSAKFCKDCAKPLTPEATNSPSGSASFNSKPATTVASPIPPTTPIATPTSRQGYGINQNQSQNPNIYQNNPYVTYSDKSRVVAGILGLFLGFFGAGRFYLGYTGLGIAQLIVSLCTFGIGSLWGTIDGIVILCGNVKTDARGYTLKD